MSVALIFKRMISQVTSDFVVEKVSMKIRVRLFGLLRQKFQDYDSEVGMEIELACGATVKEILEKLGISDHEAGIVAVNGYSLTPDSALKEGMELSVFTYISGG